MIPNTSKDRREEYEEYNMTKEYKGDDEEDDGGNTTLGGETEDDTDNFYTPIKWDEYI